MNRRIPLMIATLLLAMTVLPASAATPPLVPFDSTADLIVYDEGCDCLLEIGEDGTASLFVDEATLAAGDTEAATVSADEAGVAVGVDGSVYVVNEESNSVLRVDPAGVVSTAVLGSVIETAAGGFAALEAIAFGPSGTLYGADASGENVLSMDVAAGTATVLASEADIEALPEITSADLDGGLAVDAAENVYAAGDGSPNAVIRVAPGGTVSVVATAPDEIQAVWTDATGGTFTMTFDGQTTAPLAFDASAADVQAALVALSNIAPGDVTVTGAGTDADAWLVTFTGTLSGTDVSTLSPDGTGLTGGAVSLSVEVSGAEFSDLDVYATTRADGAIVVADDCCGGDDIFAISASGEVTALLVGRQLDALTGNNTDLEGGIAFDEDGLLYIANRGNNEILRFDGTSGVVWVSSAELDAANGADGVNLSGGIAFRMPIVDLSPTITAPSEAVAGDVLTYTVTVANDGPNAVDAFALTTTGLDGATVSGATTDLAAGASVDLTVQGTVPSDATGTLALSVTTSASLGAIDTDATNDVAEANVSTTTSADVTIATSAPASLAVEGSADIVVTVTNEGPSDATDVVVTDTLPAGTVLQVADGGDFACSEDGGVVTCTRGSMPAGATATIVLTVTTDELDCTAAGEDAPVECSFDGAVLSSLVNQASVTSATSDPVDDNNAASATMVLDTSEVEVDLPAAGVTTNGLATSGLASLLFGLVLLHIGRRRSVIRA